MVHLTDEQWNVLAPLIPQPVKRTARGRPRRDDREVLEGILWILRTGAQWSELPQGEYPPKSTCHERFQEWNEQNAFPRILQALYEQLEDLCWLNLSETFIDGTFSPAKKGGPISVPPRRGKVPRS